MRGQPSVTPPAATHSAGRSAKELLLIAAWFGLLTGLLETVCRMGVRGYYALDNLAVTTLFNFALFIAIGALYLVGHCACRRVFTLTGLTFLFSVLAINNWSQMLFAPRLNWPRVLIALLLGLRCAYLFHRYQKKIVWFQRRALPWMAALALLSAFIPVARSMAERRAEAALPQPSAHLRNVLVIVVDTLRADHLPVYGYARNTSPNLARIAQQGVTFDNAIAATSWTLPSHASMITGRYPHEHGAETEKSVLNGRLPVVGEYFENLGYRTGAFSANTSYFTRGQGFGRGFIHFEDFASTFTQGILGARYAPALMGFAQRFHRTWRTTDRRTAEDINERALRWIDRSNGSRPFFVFLNYLDVHGPYKPAARYGESFLRPGHTGGRRLMRLILKLPPEELRDEVDSYDDCIRYVDVQLAKLLQELQRRGLDKDTVVVITSDHGEAFDEHGFLQHGNALYREVIHVPLIVWAPGYVPAGVRIARPVSTTALAATLLDLVGDAQPPASFSVSSLAALWQKPQQSADAPPAFSELAHMNAPRTWPSSHGALQSVVTPEWHFIQGPDGPELFRCCDNAIETENMANTPAGRVIALRLAGELNLFREHTSSASRQSAGQERALNAGAKPTKD